MAGSSGMELAALEEELREALERGGTRAALRYLNARTRHRFTALYAFDAPWLRNVCTVDRENPDLLVTADCRIADSYCRFVYEDAQRFVIEDASSDARLGGHPKRHELLGYCGVPVLGDGGACVGTLCHFDPRPRLAPMAELSLLERAARLLAPLVVPGRAAAGHATTTGRSALAG